MSTKNPPFYGWVKVRLKLKTRQEGWKAQHDSSIPCC